MEKTTDAKLVARARAGERRAFDCLVERYQVMATRVALGMVGQEEVARELVQEALVQAYLSLERLREDSSFRSWLYGIVLNVCRSHLRTRKFETLSLEDLAGGVRLDRDGSLSAPDPQAMILDRELQEKVFAAVRALSPGDRAATLLFYYDELTLREIATALGVSVVAVKGRLHKSRKQLRERLLPDYPEMVRSSPTNQRRRRMVTATIAGVIMKRIHPEEPGGKTEGHCIYLLDETGHRALPIWIGASEALAIDIGLSGRATPRPLTFDFIVHLLKAMGGEVQDVRVDDLRDNTYYAVTRVHVGGATHELDTRPSDALGLAVRVGCPIFMTKRVLDHAGFDVPESGEFGVAVPQRFTERARKVLIAARDDAGSRGETQTGTEHLLLALLQEPEGTGARVLAKQGLSLEQIRAETEQQMSTTKGDEGVALVLTPRSGHVIYRASEEVEEARAERIGTEHLLLGLLREGTGLGGRVLIQLGAELERTRAAIGEVQGENAASAP